MNHKKQLRDRACATTEHPSYVHGSYATKPNDIAKDNGVTRRRRLRIPSQPAQNCNPKTGTAENPEICDQWGGGIRWNGINTYLSWGKHKPDAKDGQVNHRDGQHCLELNVLKYVPAFQAVQLAELVPNVQAVHLLRYES